MGLAPLADATEGALTGNSGGLADATGSILTGNAGVLVLSSLLLVFLLSFWLGGKDHGSKGNNASSDVGGEIEDTLRSLGHPLAGHICDEATCVPSMGLVLGNAEEP